MPERKQWTREETIVAFNLYCKIPFGKIHKANPEVIALAKIIDRTPSAVGMKLGNIGRLDPELRSRGIGGLAHGAALEAEVWNEFSSNWDALAYESERLLQKFKNESETDVEKSIKDIPLPIGADRMQSVKVRINQSFFRSAVLSAYDGKCCLSGLDTPQLLIASHIKPWAKSDRATERTNPRNGLCLCAIYDRAFDNGLLTIDTEYTVILSRRIKNALPADVIDNFFLRYEGKQIALPQKFQPLKELLAWHNQNVFVSD